MIENLSYILFVDDTETPTPDGTWQGIHWIRYLVLIAFPFAC